MKGIKIIIVDKLSGQVRNNRRSVIVWFCYHFLMVVLCCTNLLFFICNWYDLKLSINDLSNILLTIIGFLFAFAGINLYSIFHTNIETEKERLIEMRETYENKMKIILNDIDFSSNITMLQLYCQLIFTSQKNNSQILEWVQKSLDLLKNIEQSLTNSKHNECLSLYNQKNDDVIAVSRGMVYLADIFMNKITDAPSYFGNLDNNNIAYIKERITELRDILNKLGGYTEDDIPIPKPSLKRIVCNILSKIKARLVRL